MCNSTDSTTRLLVVYGSEMGSTKVEAKKIVESWSQDTANAKQTITLIEGDKAADKFDTISQDYDVLLVLVASYGDGDAPAGYGKFLYKCYKAAQSRSNPLDGMQHAVLGFGSTSYYTFQNVPRLTDRLLGQSGSRRFLMRVEIDEMEDLKDNEKNIENWATEVIKFSRDKRNFSKDPVCDWTSPNDGVYEKKLGPDGYELGSGPSEYSGTISAIAVASIAVGVYAYYYRFKGNEESADL